uniref:Uncharacterized protein n=1 Tax=Marseillevirus LCMAC101 TaxID=2506602 RepID=A0A481YRA5_9VIRU|nr:MAG: hypothetical protein LCMAC101_03170 [Marseillevirus LCMAC101]
MCLKCHGKNAKFDSDSPEMVDALKNPQFEKWNSCSVSHMFITYSGVDGWRAQDLAAQIIENLIKYLRENNKTNVETWLPQAFGEPDNIEKMYFNMKNYTGLKIQSSEFSQRQKAVFHEDFLNQFFPF